MSRLKDKYALITGGTSGIGFETARQFLNEGATVAITGRNITALQQAGEQLGNEVVLLQSDSADIAAQKILAEKLAKLWPRLDVLYVNAADVTHQPIQDWDEATFEQVINTNLTGPFFLIQSLLTMLSNPSSVILCGSVSAHIGLAQSSVYAASKAAILSLARTLSGEFIGRGIRVNSLSPGPTQTPALKKLGLSAQAEQSMIQEIHALVPLKRMGTPLELAKAAVFLASDESSYMLGAELLIDGGVYNL